MPNNRQPTIRILCLSMTLNLRTVVHATNCTKYPRFETTIALTNRVNDLPLTDRCVGYTPGRAALSLAHSDGRGCPQGG